MEYKFRAKNKDNGNWEYGYYVKYIRRQVSPIGDFLDESDVVHLIFQSGFADWNMERPLNAVEVIPETVGLSSNLYDINKKEIFEGDILFCSQEINGNLVDKHVEKGYVEVKHGAFGLHRRQGYYRPFKDWLEDYEYEVIGNIHDEGV